MFNKEEAKNLRLEFWSRFENYSSVRRKQKGKPAKWIMNRTGINQLKLKFDLDTEKATVGIDIETRNLDKRLELMDKMESVRTILEKSLGSALTWEIDHILPTGKSISRICLEKRDVSIYEKDTWPEVFPFFYKNMMKLEEFFGEYRDYLK